MAAPESSPPVTAAGGSGQSWISYAVNKALELPAAVDSSIIAAADSIRSGLASAVAASSTGLSVARREFVAAKGQYNVYEDITFAKIKEGVVAAASNPGISSGVAAGVGLIVFRGPRQMIIRNIRHLFLSEESRLSDAKEKVNELSQSISLLKNESLKLEERASKAEAELVLGQQLLKNEGKKIQRELRYIDRLEKEALGLKELISEFPQHQVSSYRSELAKHYKELKEKRRGLKAVVSNIIDHGVRV